jgi:hypothetical protein
MGLYQFGKEFDLIVGWRMLDSYPYTLKKVKPRVNLMFVSFHNFTRLGKYDAYDLDPKLNHNF